MPFRPLAFVLASFAQLAASCLLAVSLPPSSPARAQGPVLFDAHLHYDADHAAVLAPDAVLERLDQNGTAGALVTSTPPETVLELHRRAPRRIVPLLGVYREAADKQHWHRDEALPPRVAAALAGGPWRGIGELHIFAPHRHSSVFRRVVDMAADADLVLQMHCDPAVIDALFEQRPDVTVVWAHGGRYPYPPLLRDYLQRYPRLHVDLSKRSDRIAPGGTLREDWLLLMMELPERFMVGVDTFSLRRWRHYADHAGAIRAWLADLPEDTASLIACANAARLFEAELCEAGP